MKGPALQHSLTIILAAHNSQRTLEEQVQRLLELATDMTRDFEILIVDDGSTDATEELAHDLSVRYPQVEVIRHPRRCGVAQAIRSGMARTRGDVIFVQDETGPISPADARRLWSLSEAPDLVSLRTVPKPLERRLLDRLTAWGAKIAPPRESGALQMIRREGAEEHPQELDQQLLELEPTEMDRKLRRHIRAPKFISRLRDFVEA